MLLGGFATNLSDPGAGCSPGRRATLWKAPTGDGVAVLSSGFASVVGDQKNDGYAEQHGQNQWHIGDGVTLESLCRRHCWLSGRMQKFVGAMRYSTVPRGHVTTRRCGPRAAVTALRRGAGGVSDL
jgi:hypothetical protein